MPKKIITVIKSQIGVQEDITHTNRGEAKKYQDAVGLPHGQGFAWCQSLVYWCGLEAYGAANPVPKTAGVLDCLNQAKAKKYKIIDSADATPENIPSGAQFIMDLGKGMGHTGLVISVDADGRLHTIEGNSNNDGSRDGYEVCEQSKRHLHDAPIKAYIIYDYPDEVVA